MKAKFKAQPKVSVIDRLNENKTRVGYSLLIIFAAAVLLRFTPVIHIFWINWITAFIVSNWLWILLIAILLLILGKMEQIMFERKLEEERRKNHE